MTDVLEDQKEDTYRLALESVARWVQRWYDNDFEDRVVIKAIESVVDTALEE